MEALTDFLSACVAMINLPYTILFLAMIMYWVAVIVGAMDLDLLEFDIPVDADVGSALDADVDGDVDIAGDGFLRSLLQYLNVGEVPVTIILSIFIISLWAIAIVANYYLNPMRSVLLSFAIFVPNVIISIHMAKFFTMPLVKVFKSLNEGAEDPGRDLSGKVCVVKTSEANGTFGQAEIKTKGVPVLVNVRTDNGEVLKKGTEAVVVEKADKGVYIISKLDLE
ncbi:MAG: DUF1449 family protein [Spartobacteria bacterium]|nr:DUF1449 family protein [Spartobacteria bacterium]